MYLTHGNFSAVQKALIMVFLLLAMAQVSYFIHARSRLGVFCSSNVICMAGSYASLSVCMSGCDCTKVTLEKISGTIWLMVSKFSMVIAIDMWIMCKVQGHRSPSMCRKTFIPLGLLLCYMHLFDFHLS